MRPKKKLKVGITGGIGSGKTSACQCFKDLSIPIYYADERAKWLMNNKKPLVKQIKSLLGTAAYDKNGQLNRAYVADTIFKNRTLLQKINELVHPAVRKDAEEWHEQQDSPYTIQEAALFYETGSYKKMDKMIVVFAPIDLRIARTMARDNKSGSEVKNRINNQLSDWHKLQSADYAIYNEKDISFLKLQVQTIHEKLLSSTTL